MAGGGCTYTTDEALSSAGFGRFQALLLVFLGTGWVAEAWRSCCSPSWGRPWRRSSGSPAGRRASSPPPSSPGCSSARGWEASALTDTAEGLVFCSLHFSVVCLSLRFVVGLGLGSCHVLSTWFLEFVPAENRGSWMAAFACFWTLGTILEALLAWAIMPMLGWRWLFALSSIPCFILLTFSGLIPESPRYLCLRGKTSEAIIVLEKIARMNNRSLPPGTLTSDSKRRADNNLDVSVTTLLLIPEGSLGIEANSKSNAFNEFRALWSRDLIRSTFLLWFFNLSSYFAYYGMVVLTSELNSSSRDCASVGANLMKPNDSSLYINVPLTSFAEFPGLLLAALLVDRFGRKVSMGGMILLCCAFLAPLAARLEEGVAIILLFCARACIMGSFAVLHAYSPEVYPTFCRNTGVGASSTFNRVGSMVAPLVLTALLEKCHQKEAVLLMDLALFLAGVACALFPLETKGCEI
ncbi:hypothetical protein ACP4OV_018940 [Aristida adscensionis]